MLAIHLSLQGGLVEVGETLIDMSWKQSKKIRKQKWKRKYSQNTQYLRENSKVLKHATPTKQSTVKLRFHFTCQIIRWCRKNEWQWRKTLAKINRMLRNNPLDKYILSSEQCVLSIHYTIRMHGHIKNDRTYYNDHIKLIEMKDRLSL